MDLKPKRLEFSDLLRALGTIAVIFVHASGDVLYNISKGETFINSNLLFNWLSCNFFNSVTRWAVPVFVMISGSMLLNPDKDESVTLFFKKRFSKIFIPFLFWSAVYALYSHGTLIAQGKPLPIVDIIKSFLFGETFHHLWFVPMIIGLYFLTPTFKVFIKYATKNEIEYFLVLWFFVTIVSTYYPTFFLIKYIGWLGYIGLFVTGYYLSRYELPFKKVIYVFSFVSILITFFGTWYYSNIDYKLYENFFIYLTPTCILISVGFYEYIKTTQKFNNINNIYINKLILIISKNSYGIYLSHLFILEYLKHGYLGIKMYNDNFLNVKLDSIIAVPLLVTFTLIIALVLVNTLKKIPYIRRIV